MLLSLNSVATLSHVYSVYNHGLGTSQSTLKCTAKYDFFIKKMVLESVTTLHDNAKLVCSVDDRINRVTVVRAKTDVGFALIKEV